MPQPPKRFLEFKKKYKKVSEAYEALGEAVHASGPLNIKTRALVKLGISTGARLEGAVHSHVRKAIAAGATPEEIRHAIILALPTIGLPSMMAALSWADDVLPKKK
jgi:alkylhydroperoxidase/carboxymuconolactone decarboxylase family protein YurZ